MAETDAQSAPNLVPGKAFFDRAEQVADTGNWDFAIELYLEGIAREPGNIHQGHQPLREVALKRTASGHKGPGMLEKLKRSGGKDPVTVLTNAEYLLAKEPGSEAFMEQTLKAAQALNDTALIQWICDILFSSQRQKPKASKRTLQLLIGAYRQIEQYAAAVEACQLACQLAPNDGHLQEQMMDLSARYTIKKGRYDQEGDFKKSVRDMDKQKDLAQEDSLVKSDDYMTRQIVQARAQYEAEPTVTGKITVYVDALLKPEDDDLEAQALAVLQKAFEDTQAYQFKVRIGDIRIRQMTRQYRTLVQAGDKAAAAQHAREQLAFELEEYAERSVNYPTDLGIKYELGRRQLLAGKFDEAIGSLQQAQREPRHHISAMSYLGQAFARKGWLDEAIDTFERAMEGDVPERKLMDLRYYLGDALSQTGEFEKAQEMFSQIAQVDFTYRDVRERIEKIRAQRADASESAGS